MSSTVHELAPPPQWSCRFGEALELSGLASSPGIHLVNRRIIRAVSTGSRGRPSAFDFGAVFDMAVVSELQLLGIDSYETAAQFIRWPHWLDGDEHWHESFAERLGKLPADKRVEVSRLAEIEHVTFRELYAGLHDASRDLSDTERMLRDAWDAAIERCGADNYWAIVREFSALMREQPQTQEQIRRWRRAKSPYSRPQMGSYLVGSPSRIRDRIETRTGKPKRVTLDAWDFIIALTAEDLLYASVAGPVVTLDVGAILTRLERKTGVSFAGKLPDW